MNTETRCGSCGETRKGDEFADETGYECPRCFSNVFLPVYRISAYDVPATSPAPIPAY